MKKTARLMAILLVLCSCLVFPVTAFAAEDVSIYLDGDRISNIYDAYVTSDGVVYVQDWDDVEKIFPDEASSTLYVGDDDVNLSQYVEEWGYYIQLHESRVDIYSYGYYSSCYPDFSYYPPYTDYVNVYRNGYLCSSRAFAYQGNETVFLQYPLNTSLSEIFGTNISTSSTCYTLSDWATYYGYVYVRSGNRVFINNDGQKPIDVIIDGNIVSFPDQQPVVVAPGRTMVPIRAIGEALGLTVTWNSGSTVTLSSNKHTIRLYVNSTYYEVDGRGKRMDCNVYVLNDRTMVPVRFISEVLGYTVEYDGSGPVDHVVVYKK